MSLTTHHPQRPQAIGMLVLATLFWGLSFPLIKALMLLHAQLSPEAGSWFVTVYVLAPRFTLAAVILALWQWRGLGDFRRSEWKQGAGLGVFSAAGMLFQSDGMQFTTASASAFLTQFYAILIPIYLAVRHRRNPGAFVWACCALVLAGVAVLGQFDWRALRLGRGELETLICSVFFMGQILWLERTEFRDNRAGRTSLAMFSTQAVIYGIALVALAPAGGAAGVDAGAGAAAAAAAGSDVWEALVAPWRSAPWVGMTLMLTVVCTVGAYSLMNAWQPKITATEAGLIYCVEPIFGAMMALFLPAWFSAWSAIDYANETATWTLLVGGGLITAANILIQFKPVAKPAAAR